MLSCLFYCGCVAALSSPPALIELCGVTEVSSPLLLLVFCTTVRCCEKKPYFDLSCLFCSLVFRRSFYLLDADDDFCCCCVSFYRYYLFHWHKRRLEPFCVEFACSVLYECLDGWMVVCFVYLCGAHGMDGWMDGWIDGWMDEWMDGWMDGYLFIYLFIYLLLLSRQQLLDHNKENVLYQQQSMQPLLLRCRRMMWQMALYGPTLVGCS